MIAAPGRAAADAARVCDLCGATPCSDAGELGPLLGPVGDIAGRGQGYYAHRLCAMWSNQVRRACACGGRPCWRARPLPGAARQKVRARPWREAVPPLSWQVWVTDEKHSQGPGIIKELLPTIKAGRRTCCSHCGKHGATVSCCSFDCGATFHLVRPPGALVGAALHTWGGGGGERGLPRRAALGCAMGGHPPSRDPPLLGNGGRACD